MNANLPDAEMMVAMGDPKVDLTAGVEPSVRHLERNSPVSAVCYMSLDEAQEPPANTAESKHTPSEGHDGGVAGPAPRAVEESDSTPRSEVPSAMDAVAADPQRLHKPEPGYFSPRPLRLYGSKLPASAPASTDPSPTTSLNASTASVNAPDSPPGERADAPSVPADQLGRPSVHRDLSSNSTATLATVRPHSVDPLQTFTPPSRQQRDGPHYPNQSYAALHSQEYPPPRPPPSGRIRNPHSAHYSSFSAAHISTFGLPQEHHRDSMESGSRTVGNSPASSPGLFSPTTPPLRHTQQPDDGHYSSPYLHHTHRQAPKETHVADVDVDPVSGRKIINQYEVIDELGRGVHGKVKLGRNLETGVTVAIKIVDRYSKRRRLGKNTSHEDKIKREIAILKKARHPNIVSLLEVIDDPTRKKVYIVLEHVELGEVKWRTEGEKEVCLIEWRRYRRESQGIFDNESAVMEDERILALAQQKIERQRRRRARLMHMRRYGGTDNEPWSLEHGGDSEDEVSGTSRQPQTSPREDEQTSARHRPNERWEGSGHHESNMETAVRSTTPTATSRPEDPTMTTGLEGTMYGAYDTDLFRGRAPSLADSSSSHLTDEEDEIPEHFRYVPLLTMQAAREIFRDTVLGLEYLHYQKVVHRDIKPANLLQTKEHRIKISDFGVSYLGRQTAEETNGDQSESDAHDVDEAIELAKTVGTPAFYAPELCRTDIDADTPQVDEGIDIWALGVTLFCLIYGRVPFHDHNTFHLMKMISDDEVYLPQWRLKAVAEQSGSRPNSHGRMYHSMTSSKRAPHDLDYEEVDDTLRDLLKRLLIKDSRRRIKIKEIKHHPWVLQGVDNFPSWVAETDPSRSSQGRKIEVSKEDLDKAVVPLTLIDRVRSGVRKTLDTVLGIGMGRRTGSRRRAQSTATNQDQSQSISTNSSSSTISQEGRRPSLAINQSIFEALSRSREPEHPLSQSVTASPEARERAKYFDGPNSRTASPAYSVESTDFLAPSGGSFRPLPPERAHSIISSAGSVRTVRPADPRAGGPASPSLPPALPGTPTALDAPGGSNLGGIFGGVPRRLVNNVRSRERMLRLPHEHTRAKSIDRLADAADDAHSEPSLALSTTMAAGHVDQPDILKELSPTLARGPSPHLSDLNSPDPTERASSRQSSISSASSHLNRTYGAHSQFDIGLTQEAEPWMRPLHWRETSDERYGRPKSGFVRRRVVEENLCRDRPLSLNIQRPPSALSQCECPPSPDDEAFFQRQKVEDYLSRGHVVSQDSNLVGYPAQPKALTSSSSEEDHFTSMSQSTSNPSIPSVASANSSVAPDDCLHMQQTHSMATAPSGDSINQFNTPSDDPAGYDGDGDGDHPLESDDDESDEEDFIMMGSKKPGRSGSIPNVELARPNIRKEYLSSRRRSTRSGSNGTVKKVRPPGDSDHESRA